MRALSTLAILALSCAPPIVERPDAGPEARFEDRPLCHRAYTQVPEDLGVLPVGLEEVSGIVASPTTPGVLWVHGDGDEAVVFAIRETDAAVLGRVVVQNAVVDDIEDIAAGRCEAGFCLYLADTGDNARARDNAAVFVFPEPEVDLDTPFENLSIFDVTRIPIRFPNNEAVDVEALAVTASGERMLLFEKVDAARARVFVSDAPFEATTLLAELETPGAAIPLGRAITGADLHPSGQRLLLRVYTGMFEYVLEDQPLESLGDLSPFTITFGPLSEPQGETIAYDGSGLGIVSASEDPDARTPQPLHHFICDG